MNCHDTVNDTMLYPGQISKHCNDKMDVPHGSWSCRKFRPATRRRTASHRRASHTCTPLATTSHTRRRTDPARPPWRAVSRARCSPACPRQPTTEPVTTIRRDQRLKITAMAQNDLKLSVLCDCMHMRTYVIMSSFQTEVRMYTQNTVNGCKLIVIQWILSSTVT